jgi:DNA polymerase III gamma/tau subunit
MIDINKEYEGLTFDDVVGLDQHVALLTSMKQVPQVGLFHGTIGCGKNMLAYLLAQRLENPEIVVRDSADSTAKSALELIEQFNSPSLFPNITQVCVLDEFHQFRRDAQAKFKNVLQAPPERTYFFVCSAEPERIIADIHSRFRLKIQVRALTEQESYTLVDRLCKKNSDFLILDKKAKLQIAKGSKGIPRIIVYTINSLLSFEGIIDDNLIASVLETSAEGVKDQNFYLLFKAIMTDRKLRAYQLPTLLDNCNSDAESLRYKMIHTVYKNYRGPRAKKLLEVLVPPLTYQVEKQDLLSRLSKVLE